MFDDLFAANEKYQAEFQGMDIPGVAAKGLAVLTCIDSRIDPLSMLGLHRGDAKILRNAGARVTPDALRSLVLAVNLLGVTRVCLVQHTDCAMGGSDDDEMRRKVTAASGVDASDWDFLSTNDQLAVLRSDLETVAACPLLPASLVVGGFVYDVHTGALRPAEL